MPAFIAAGADLLGGFLQQQQANRAYDLQRSTTRAGAAAARGVLNQARSADLFQTNLQEAQLKSGHKKQLRGFQTAGRALDLGGNVARAGVRARGAQDAGAVEQSVVSRGLAGTSIGTQALQGSQDQTSRQLAAIDAQLAQAFADLNLQQGTVEGQQSAELANLIGGYNARDQERYQALFGLEQLGHPAKRKGGGLGDVGLDTFLTGGLSSLF